MNSQSLSLLRHLVPTHLAYIPELPAVSCLKLEIYHMYELAELDASGTLMILTR